MKVSFTSQTDFTKYKLGNSRVRKIPKMTDEQVDNANKTRQMPDGYFVMTKETNMYNKNGHLKKNYASSGLVSTLEYEKPVITVIKGEKNYPHYDMPSYYDTLPQGFELENNILGTYIKASDVNSALFNRVKPPLYITGGAVIGWLLSKVIHLRK